jgi:YVTN family beta-propeller protein
VFFYFLEDFTMFRKLFPSLSALILICFQLASVSHASPFAYICNQDTNDVSVIDLESNTVTATIPVGAHPQGLAVNPAGTRVYVANWDSNNVSVIDTGNNTELTKVTVGTSPMRVAVHPSGAKVYVSNNDSGTVSVIDAANNTVTDTINVGSQPRGLSVNPAGTKLYVANFNSDNISVIDTVTDTVSKTIPITGDSPIDLAITPDGSKVYVINYYSHNVSVIDTASDTESVNNIAVGQHPIGVWVNPARAKVYVANVTTDNVMVIDLATNGVTDTVTGFNAPVSVEGSPDGSRLYVVEQLNNRVSVLNAANYSVIAYIGVGSGPRSYNGNFIAAPNVVADGLVSLWRGENNAFDVIGGNHGAWSGTSAYAAGKSSQAFNFNGTNTYLDVANTPSLDFGTGNFTISFWMNLNSLTQQTFVHKTVGDVTNNTNQTYFVEYDTSNSLRFRTSDSTVINDLLAPVTLSTGVWYQVTAVRSGSSNTLYLNGSPIGSQTSSGAADTGSGGYFRIGQIAPNGATGLSRYVNGKMDEIAIYSRALSAKEVLKLYDPNGPVAWWKGENNADDSIGDNNGTLQGEAAYSTGQTGQAFSFSSATHDGVTVPSGAALNPTEAITMSAWIKPTATSNDWPYIIGKRSAPFGAIQYSITISNRNTFTCDITGAGVNAEGGTVPLNQWSHVACTYDRNTLRLYVNGVEVASAAGSATMVTGNEPLTIGKLDGSDIRYFDGQIDEVKIYSRSLSAAEVANDYGLVSWWKGENNPLDSVGVKHGTWNGAPSYEIGTSGNAFSFDGWSSHVVTGDLDNDAISASFWFKRNSMPHRCGGLVTKMMDGDLSAWAVYLNGDRIHVRTDTTSSGQQYLESSTVFSSGVWYHAVFVYDKTNVKLYVNGVLDQTQTAGAVLNGNDYPITLGSAANGANLCTDNSHFDGLIDEVKIFNRSLSIAEVGALSGQVPDPFSFSPQTGVALNTTIESNPITVTGIVYPAAISTSGGEYAVSTDGGITWGAWANSAWTVSVNSRVKVRLTSPTTFAASSSTTLTIGGVSAAFTVTTRSAPADNWSAFAASSYGGGDGSVETPYLIATPSQLAKLAADAAGTPSFSVGKYFVLTEDIDLAAHQWAPVPEFRGNFDGRGHKVLNLTIDNSGADRQGLFGQIKSGAALSDIGLVNAIVVGHEYVGALVGHVSSGSVTISGCYSTGAIVAYAATGGLLGCVEASMTLSNSWSSCEIRASGTAAGRPWAGGLVGLMGTGTSTITKCYSTGSVNNGWNNSGGLVALNYSGNLTITNCFTTGNVVTSATNWNNVGGILGLVGPYSSTTISNCYHSGNILGSDGSGKTGGIVGGNDGAPLSVTNSYYNSANAPGQGGGTPTSVTDMKTASFVTALNGSQNPLPWLLDSGNVNGGFPLLAGMPSMISFISQSGMPLSTPIISNTVPVNFIGVGTSISVSAGEYSVSTDNGSTWGDWTNSAGMVNPNNLVRVRQTSSAGNSNTTTATLTIGGVNGDFTVTTAAAGDPNATGLVSWWRGENNSYDSVSGNHGEWSGGASYTTGVASNAFSLDGNSNFIEIPDATNLNPTDAITVSAWYKPVSFSGSGNDPIVDKGYTSHTAPYYQYHLGVSGNQYHNEPGQFIFSVGAGGEYVSVNTPQDFWNPGVWYHIVGTYDGANLKLFVNGQLIDSKPVSGTLTPYGRPIRIGAYDNYDGKLPGTIDEVKIYNRALSAVEASRLAGTYPDVFNFPSKDGVELNTLTESDSITVTGITQPAPIYISGSDAQYEIGGNGTWLSTPSMVSNGATVKVRLTSSSSYSTTTTATLNIGGREGTFSVTTIDDTVKPVVDTFSIDATESTTMAVQVSSFTASDLGGVTGYMITSSPTAPLAVDAGWSASAPTIFNLATAGANTLYAWAKDQAGNVSDSLSTTVTLKPVRRDQSPYSYYDSISNACSDAAGGETIKALAVTVPGSVTITGKSLTIKGGHADGYGSQPGVTAIQGTLTVGTGSLTVDRVAVR